MYICAVFIFYVVAGYVYFVNNGSLVFCWFLNKIFLIKKNSVNTSILTTIIQI